MLHLQKKIQFFTYWIHLIHSSFSSSVDADIRYTECLPKKIKRLSYKFKKRQNICYLILAKQDLLDISRGATPIVVLCGNLSIDQHNFCVSCLRCYWYEPTLVCDSSQSIQRNCGTSSPAPQSPRTGQTGVAELDGSKHPVTANNDDSYGLGES